MSRYLLLFTYRVILGYNIIFKINVLIIINTPKLHLMNLFLYNAVLGDWFYKNTLQNYYPIDLSMVIYNRNQTG